LSFQFSERSTGLSLQKQPGFYRSPAHRGGPKIEDKCIFDDTQDETKQDFGWLLLKTENSKLKTV
jgi:hypothetical protein